MKTNRILVPLDGSEMAEAAIPDALGMARSGSSTLMLVRAANARSLPGTDVIGEQIEAVREAEEYLAAMKEKLEKEGARQVQTHVWYGPAAPALVEAARVQKADLIVMSTHGRSGLGRLIFGSVAESVLRGTTVPILLVRPTGAPVERPTGQGDARPVKTSEPTPGAEALR
jgi:nucleotide-binding universal stress UspA family protein